MVTKQHNILNILARYGQRSSQDHSHTGYNPTGHNHTRHHKQRVKHIDVLKGLSIILVVLGHSHWVLEHASWRKQTLVITSLLVSGYAFTMHLWPYLVMTFAPNAHWYGNELVRLGLPFGVDIVLLSSFFFLLGFLLKHHVVHFRFRPWWLAVALLFFVGMHIRYDYALHFFGRRYDHLLWTTLIALAGIYAMTALAWFASQQPVLERAISFIGYNSLFVLIFH